ncbi:MAG TPA: hypothetical protein VKU40_15040 [Thermoanaerobaculia bacterium]|nr:hypothetical protein [Thermoanaerobaculia bacterium]
MSGVESLLATRATFVLAALVVSWLAVLLLALVAANLHFRLVRLERGDTAAAGSGARKPFAHLLGQHLGEALGGAAPGARLAVVLSAHCASCDRVLARLRETAGDTPLALLWRDAVPSPLPPLPAGATVVEDGPAVCRRLGVRLTPFALAIGPDGRVLRAAPVGNPDALDDWLDGAARPAPAEAHPVTSTPLAQPSLKGLPT